MIPDEIEEPTDEDASEFEGRPVEYVPMLPATDPRAIDASVKALKNAARLAELERTTLHVGDLVKIAGRFAEGVQHVLRLIPGWVAESIREGDSPMAVQAIIEDKTELAKVLIRGVNADTPGGDTILAACSGASFPSVVQLTFDAIEDPDGEPVMPRDTADLAKLWPLLKTFPAFPSGAEFG
jgi:hypothetical protein